MVLRQDLVHRQRGLARFAITVDKCEDELESGWVISHGVVGEPTQHHLKCGKPARLAVFGHGNTLAKNLLQDSAYRATPLWSPTRIAGFPRFEPVCLGRPTKTDFVISSISL